MRRQFSNDKSMVLLIFYRGDAVDFDVEGTGPVGDVDKDAGGRIGGEEFGVDGINGREVVDGGTVDVAFEDVVEVGAGSFEATLHLLEDELGLAFDGRVFGGVDILVNNAGIYGFTPIETITDEVFWTYYNINVLGAIHCIQEAIKLFKPEGGTIINIGSAVVTMDIPMSLVYTSSKYVMDSMTRMLAKVAAFLASDESAWVTGELIAAAGGMR
jgi:NAD(P)-dependent dehydrogenase (short-subunit alcohol dehydrogenase family)